MQAPGVDIQTIQSIAGHADTKLWSKLWSKPNEAGL